MIVKVGDKFEVRSMDGKSMGSYASRAAAEKRLKEIEMYKALAAKSPASQGAKGGY